MRRVRRTASIAYAMLGGVTAAVLLGAITGCGVITSSDEYVATVDSLLVTPAAAGSAQTRITFYGVLGSNLCAELRRVDRRSAGDTITWRFIARQQGGNCLQAIPVFQHVDSIATTPARTVHLRAESARGAIVQRVVQLPLAPAP